MLLEVEPFIQAMKGLFYYAVPSFFFSGIQKLCPDFERFLLFFNLMFGGNSMKTQTKPSPRLVVNSFTFRGT